MKNNWQKTTLVYVAPSIILFLFIFLYTTRPIHNFHNGYYAVEIYKKTNKKIGLILDDKNVDHFKTFRDSFFAFIPFSALHDNKRIKHIKTLYSKCNNSEFLTDLEIGLLKSYGSLLSVPDRRNPNNYYSNLGYTSAGYISAIVFLVTAYFMLKKVKNVDLKTSLRFLFTISVLINFGYQLNTFSNKRKIEPNSFFGCINKYDIESHL